MITTSVEMPIKVSDIKTLFPGKWLNDQVSDILVQMICHKITCNE